MVAETQIVINAPIERVWQAMLDTRNYALWNPFITKVVANGDVAKPGTEMTLHVKWQNAKLVSSGEIIKEVEPPHADGNETKKALWSYTFNEGLNKWGLVKAIRYQWLTQQTDGTTLYKTREEFGGLLKAFIPLAKVQDGFERHAAALKAYCEKNT